MLSKMSGMLIPCSAGPCLLTSYCIMYVAMLFKRLKSTIYKKFNDQTSTPQRCEQIHRVAIAADKYRRSIEQE